MPKPNRKPVSSLLTSTVPFASHGKSADLHFHVDISIFHGQA